MKRHLTWTLVLLTALLCLGTTGYAEQTRRAKETAASLSPWWQNGRRNVVYGAAPLVRPIGAFLAEWRRCPWYGTGMDGRWMLKRTYREILVRLTGLDLGDDPAIWSAWFDAQPVLMWDDRAGRLVTLADLPRP